MKLLFDQNISFRILRTELSNTVECTHIKKESLVNASDLVIWKYAKNHGYTIVTQDSDFEDIKQLRGFPPKVIWIRTGNLKTNEISDLLIQHWEDLNAFMSDDLRGSLQIVRIPR